MTYPRKFVHNHKFNIIIITEKNTLPPAPMTKASFFFVALFALDSTAAFVTSYKTRHSSPLVFAGPSTLFSPLQKLQKSSFLLGERQETKLLAANVADDGVETTENVGPSAFFLLASAALGKLFFEIQGSGLEMTVGMWALLLTTTAVGYDNLIIGLGALFFGDAESNEKTYSTLKNLSYPRFTAHAVLVPFLYTTVAEIGKLIGVSWLQEDYIQTLMIAAAATLAVLSRFHFVNSPGIDLSDTSDSEGTWVKNLIWFTYKEPTFLSVIPSIILALFTVAVGVAAFGGEARTAAIWMIVSGVSVLYGNAKPSYIQRFTGNLGELAMLWSFYEAASLVMNK
jgi:hypothetical protein